MQAEEQPSSTSVEAETEEEQIFKIVVTKANEECWSLLLVTAVVFSKTS